MGNNWISISLGDVIDITHGYGFKGEYFSDSPTSNILLTPGNFRIGGGFKTEKLKYYDGPIDSRFILASGDLVITMTDLSKDGDTLGFPAIIPESTNPKVYLHNQRLGKVIFKEKSIIDKNFLYYLLCTRPYQKTIVNGASGTTVKHTSPIKIKSYKCQIPPLPTQERIADILGTLDDKIELNRQMNRTLEAMARTIFKSWFVDFDPVYAKMEGRDYPLPAEVLDLFPDELVESELGLIPRGWEVKPLKDVISVNAKSIGKKYPFDEIQYINISSVTEGTIDNIESLTLNDAPSRAKRLVKHGDVIWSCVRPNRKSYALISQPPENLIVSTGFGVLTPVEIPSSFLYTLVTRQDYVNYLVNHATGSAYPAVKPDVFQSYSFAIPGQAFLIEFNKIVEPLLEKVHLNNQQNVSLVKIRDTLLPKLMSGEILT